MDYNSSLEEIIQLSAAYASDKSEINLLILTTKRFDFIAKYPLTKDYWFAWLKDAYHDNVMTKSIFNIANNDYLVVELWCCYLVYTFSQMFPLFYVDHMDYYVPYLGKEASDIEEEDLEIKFEPTGVYSLDEVKSIIRKAIATTMYHVDESHLVWDIIRDFEVLMLNHYLKKKQSSDAGTQLELIRTMYITRLKVPHLQISKTFEGYSTFESTFSPTTYLENLKSQNKIFQNTLTKFVNPRQKRETELSESKNSLKSFLSYIEFERRGASSEIQVNLITVLFERCLVYHCLDPLVWDVYLSYLMTHVSDSKKIKSVLERSVKNIQWSGKIWSHYLRYFDQFISTDANEEEYGKIFSKAVATLTEFKVVGELVMVFQTHCDHTLLEEDVTVEEVISAFEDAIGYINSNFSESEPQILPLYTQLIRIHKSSVPSTPKKTIETFETLLKKLPKMSQVYIDYTSHLTQIKEFKKARGIFRKAAGRSDLDDFSKFRLAFREFEREVLFFEKFGGNGDDADDLGVGNICDADERGGCCEAFAYAKAIEHVPVVVYQPDLNPVIEAVTIDQFEESSSKVRKRDEEDSKPNKKQKLDESMQVKVDEPQPQKKTIPFSEYFVIDSLSAGNMIRVTNYDKRNAREEFFNEMFSSCGRIIEIQIKPNQEAFIEFEKLQHVKAAFDLDGKIPFLLEKKLKVSRCRPLKEIWRFGSDEEPGTVFVGGLKCEIGKGEIRSLFSKFGNVKDVRILRKPNKVFSSAYVDFEDPNCAKSCLALDSTVQFGHKITVAISNPSKCANSTNFNKDEKESPSLTSLKTEIVIKNLSFKITDEQLTLTVIKELFDGDVDEANEKRIKKCKVLRNKDGLGKGVAFIEFDTEELAVLAVEKLNDFVIKNSTKKLKVSISDPNFQPQQKKSIKNDVNQPGFSKGSKSKDGNPEISIQSKTEIFIKNIPVNTSETDFFSRIITEVFDGNMDESNEKRVKKCKILAGKGTAFVEFDTEELAESAVLKLQGIEINENKITVNLVDPNFSKTQSQPPKKSFLNKKMAVRGGTPTELFSFVPTALAKKKNVDGIKKVENGGLVKVKEGVTKLAAKKGAKLAVDKKTNNNNGKNVDNVGVEKLTKGGKSQDDFRKMFGI